MRAQARARLIEFQSTDIDDQAQALSGWEQRYEQLDCGSFRGAVWQLAMADGLLLRESTNRKLREAMCPPPEHVVLAIAMSVVAGSVFAGRALDRNALMVLSGRQEYELVTAGAMDLIGISVHQDQLDRSLSSRQPGVARARAAPGPPGLAARNRGRDPPDAAGGMRRVGPATRRAAGRRRRVGLLTSTLHHAVLLAMHAGVDTQANSVPRRADSRQRVVKRALAFMAAQLHRDIGVPEISAAACASRRSLQYCFEEFLQTSPQGYLRAMRLNQARRVLRGNADLPMRPWPMTWLWQRQPVHAPLQADV